MERMLVTLEVSQEAPSTPEESKRSALNADADCAERRKGGIRCVHASMGEGNGKERTANIQPMCVTLEVSQLSG